MAKEQSKQRIYETRRRPKIPPHVSLRALRKVRGWTLDQLAEALRDKAEANYQRGTLSAIESGLRGASAKTIADLAAAYGISPDLIKTDYLPLDRHRGDAA